VVLEPFSMTQEQHEKGVGKNPSWFCADGQCKDDVTGFDTRQFPAEAVSWADADEFWQAARM
jgi:hypothetical protein